MLTQKWLYSASPSLLDVYSVPQLDFACRITPGFPLFRCGIHGNTMYVACISYDYRSIPFQTTIETYTLPHGSKASTETWPGLNNFDFPLFFNDNYLLDFGQFPQLIHLKTKSVRRVMLDIPLDMKLMSPCWHQNEVLLVFSNDGNRLRVYENPLGNYAHTRVVPRHVQRFNMIKVHAVSISERKVMICGGKKRVRSMVNPAKEVLVYDTELRMAEEEGQMPGDLKEVRMSVVEQGKVYLMMEDTTVIILDLSTGLGKRIHLTSWTSIKGLLYLHSHSSLRLLPLVLLQVITKSYILTNPY